MTPRSHARRIRAFTLIELLVVIAIIAVFNRASCSVCAGGTRTARRRNQCTNNLKQITLAIHNYIDVNNVTPLHEYRYATEGAGKTRCLARTPGTAGSRLFSNSSRCTTRSTSSIRRNGSIGVIIGPNPTDFTVNKASIATLLCPSDGIVNSCSGYAAYINYQPGNFNYVGNTGHPRNVLLPGKTSPTPAAFPH